MNLYELLGRPVVLFDTETTGVNLRTDRILQIAAIRWDQSGRQAFETLVNPGIDVYISPEAIAKHGITHEKLAEADAPPTQLALYDFGQFCLRCSLFVAHNAAYDLGIWAHELQRIGLPLPRYDFICTVALAYLTGTGIQRTNRGNYPMLGTKLEEVAQALGLTLEGAHDAGNDIAMVELILPALYAKAKEQYRPICNAVIHREFLVKRGQERPDWMPPRSEFYVVA